MSHVQVSQLTQQTALGFAARRKYLIRYGKSRLCVLLVRGPASYLVTSKPAGLGEEDPSTLQL